MVRLIAAALAATYLGVMPIFAAPAPVPPTPPGDVSASAGTTGTIAVVRWSPADGAAGYRVWRSSRSLSAFEPVGSTEASTFTDGSGVPGRTYFYRVTSVRANGDESYASTPTAGVTAEWNISPHASYGRGNLCMTCHALHRSSEDPDVSGGEVAICESCHDGRGATSNVKDGPIDSFALASGHRVEEAVRGGDLTNRCSSCHSPHADPLRRVGLYRATIAGTKVKEGGNAWCEACHDDRGSWAPGRPAPSAPERDASGYPVRGTFPGPAVYASSAASGHAGIRGVSGRQGDCLLCHAAHRGPNAYDGLLETFRAPSVATLATDQATGMYAQLCLACHDGAGEWRAEGAADIASFVRRRGDDPYTAHSIVTSGGTLPAGSPLPCYDCHNPHGSARGNGSLLSDELGARLTTRDAAGVRAFCLSCHATADGLRWDSVDATYAAVGSGTVEGLRRDGSDGSLLRLPDAQGAEHDAGSVGSCYACHGDEYSAGGSNVHAPRRAAAVSTTVPAPLPE